MAETTVVGRTTFVRGRITGDGDLEIAGRVEGEVSCSGEVLVDASGLVASNIGARRIIVRGAVKGDLTAEESIVLENGARVVGDLKAASIRIVQGGLVRGYVQTGAAGAPRARSAAASAARPSAAARPAASSASAPKPRAAPPPAPPPSTKAVAKATSARHAPPRGATLAGARPGPPPPVVPALKKGTKAQQKKRG
jgi:cytoskeletal protein CcmA (bactofilin family)